MNALFTKTAIWCLLLSSAVLTRAQNAPQSCIGFEHLPAGAYYNANTGFEPGDVFMDTLGVVAAVGNYVNTNGSLAFGDVRALTIPATLSPPFTLGQGTALWISNSTVLFEFPAGTSQVCFNFWAGGGTENIAVNGQPVQLANFPFNIPPNLAPGVSFTVTPANPPGIVSLAGTMCLTGNIHSLRLGGQEFFMDNLCYAPASLPCPAMNLQVTPQPCTPNGIFYASVNPGTPASNTASGYRLFVNGELRGTFNYAQGTVSVGPFAGDGATARTFVIQDTNLPDCRDTVLLAPVNCNNTCGITEPEVEVVDCTPEGYTLRINFQYTVAANAQGFRVVAGGQTYGPFSAQQLPLILPNVQIPTDALEFEVQVCPITSLTVICCRSVMVPAPQCPVDDCIGFEYIQGTAFGASQGHQPGHLVYTENAVPVRLLPFQDLDWITAFLELRVIQAPGTPPFAAASGKHLQLRGIGLSFNFSQYPDPVDSVSVDFFNQGQVNIAANGGQLFILPALTPGTYNLGQGVTMQVVLTSNAAQQGKLIFRGGILSLRIGGALLRLDNMCVLTPPACALSQAEYFDLHCNNAPTYNVRIRFTHQGAGGSFRVTSQGGYSAVFPYSELPVLLTAVPVPNTLNDVLTICDTENPGCCIELPVQVPCLHPCQITAFRAEALPCLDNGTYMVRFNMNHELTSPGFRLRVNGQAYGEYLYADLPITIGPFPGDGQTGLALRVQDNIFGCVAETSLDAVDCDTPACRVNDLQAFLVNCSDANTSGYLYVNFSSPLPDDTSFNLFVNNQLLGAYELSQLPLMLNWPLLAPSVVQQLRVCIQEYPDCCAQTTVQRIGCDAEGCIEFEDLPNNAFYGSESGHQNGDLAFTEAGVPVRLYEFRTSNANPVLGNARVTTDALPGFARAQGQYLLLRNINLGFDFEELGEQVISVCFDYFDDGAIENFSVNGQPLKIIQSLFQLNGQQVAPGVFFHLTPTPSNLATGRACLTGPIRSLLIGGQRLGIDNICYNTLPQPCVISELTVTALPCNAPGQYFATLNFQHQNTGAQGFTVRGNGVQYGTFSYADLPITLGPFNGNQTREFEVRDVAQPQCFSYVSLSPPPCSGIVVWPGDANNDNIAHHFDLLNIGVAYGFQGPPRSSANGSWDGMQAQPWPQSFATAGLNYAYADCDGNGVINAADVDVIRQNYGLTHGPVTPYVPLPATPNNPPLFVQMPDVPVQPGATVSAPIVLGRANLPVEAIYGLAFRIEFDPEVFAPNSVGVELINSSWLAGNTPGTFTPLLSIDRSFAQDGYIDVAITRTNRLNTGGFGPIARFRGIIDDIAGIHSEIRITGIRAIRANETPLALFNPVETFSVGDGVIDAGWLDLLLSLQVYPNPTSGEVFVENRYAKPVDEIRVFNDKGVLMQPATVNSNRVSLADIPPGMYFLRIRIGEHIFHQRVVKH